MKPQIGDIRAVAQRFNGEEWVNCLQGLPKLSDEEIIELAKQCDPSIEGIIDFARAIEAKVRGDT
jgi:hypothetical protein